MLPSTRLEAATSRYVSRADSCIVPRVRARHCLLLFMFSPLLVSLTACAHAVDQKVKIVAEAKIPKATDAAKHKAGGGNVEICH